PGPRRVVLTLASTWTSAIDRDHAQPAALDPPRCRVRLCHGDTGVRTARQGPVEGAACDRFVCRGSSRRVSDRALERDESPWCLRGPYEPILRKRRTARLPSVCF